MAREAAGEGVGDLQMHDQPIDVALAPIALDQPAHLPDDRATHAVGVERVRGEKGTVARR